MNETASVICNVASPPWQNAIIGALGVLVGVIITGVISYINNQNNLYALSLKTYKDLVCAEKLKALNLLTESIASYTSLIYFALIESCERKPLSHSDTKEIAKLSHLIQLRLNPIPAENQDTLCQIINPN